MTSYVDVFGSDTIPASHTDFASHTLAVDTTFNWPYNYSGENAVAKLMEVTCSVGVVLMMPAADEVSKGESCIIRNIGSETLIVKKSNGDALTTVASGTAVLIYIKDNSTAEGTWGTVTYGTGISSADAASLAGYGITAIGTVLNAALVTQTESSGFTADIYDRAKVFIFTGGAETAILPDVTTLPDDWFCVIKNAGTGILTIDANGAQTINDELTLVLNPDESAFLVSTSSEWFEIGQGRSVDYQFTQLIKDVTTGSPFTLTTSEASNKILKFIGTPAAGVTVIVPPTVAIYYINNALSTAFAVTVKTAAGTGVAVSQSQRSTVFCDSVDVLDAQTAAVSGAIALTDGTVSAPSLNFATMTNSGLYKISGGFAATVNGVNLMSFNASGVAVGYGYFQLPGSTAPTQIAEGAVVWDTDSDLLTIGTGAARKTMVDTDSTQALTNKTINSTTIPTSATLVVSTDVIGIATGGTGQTSKTPAFDALSPTTTKGDLIAYNGTDNVRVPVGTNGYLLKSDSTAAAGVSWTSVTIPTIEVTLTNSVTLQNKNYTNSGLFTYAAEYAAGTQTVAATKSIVWANGQRQVLTLDGAAAFLTTLTFDFTGCGVGHYQLRIYTADAFAYTLSWSTGTPGGTNWLGNSSAPALHTGGAGYSTVFNFFYGAGGFICGSGNKVGSF